MLIRTLKGKLGLLIPRTLGGRSDNYPNRVINWMLGRKKNRLFFKLLADTCKGKERIRIMEIGTYKGNTAKRMIKIAQKMGVKNVEYYGTDLFENPPNYEVRFMNTGWLPLERIKAQLEKIGARVSLFKGDTREILPAIVSSLPEMDFIYIDGGHSYETVKNDWKCVKKLIHPSTVVVFDDYWDFEGVRKVVDGIGNEFVVELTKRRAIIRKRSE